MIIQTQCVGASSMNMIDCYRTVYLTKIERWFLPVGSSFRLKHIVAKILKTPLCLITKKYSNVLILPDFPLVKTVQEFITTQCI